MTPNAGIWDQRLALQWVQKYASLFGGDPNLVTVMGEGSGGASILHHITSFDGERDPLFRQAIAVNPAWDIAPPDDTLDVSMAFIRRFHSQPVPGINEVNRVSGEDLGDANRAIVRDSPIGKYTFGPVLDKQFVVSHPLAVLKHGLRHRDDQVC